MNLEIIRTQTTWNDAAGSINSNYAKIADAIAQLKANGGGGGADIDLTDYATKVWVEAKGYITASTLTPYALKTDIPSLVGYATEDFVNNKLQNYTTTEDLVENYASKSDLESAINGIDLSAYLKAEDAKDTYATQDYVTTKLVDYAPLTSVQGFENRISGLEGAVPQLNERVTTVEGKVSSLNETVSTGENNLLDRVNTIETDYVTSGKLESAINGIDLSAYLLKADLTKSRIQSTLGISDWALASVKPTYTASEVGALGVNGTAQSALKMTPEYLTDLNSATPWRFFDMSTGYGSTAGNKPNIAWVSGITGTVAGSSVYRWQLAGTTGNARPYFRHESNGTWGNWQTIAFTSDIPTKLSQLTDDVVAGRYLPLSGGTLNGSITATSFIGNLTGNADSATKLATPPKLWGQRFDGTEDVSGTFRQLYTGSYDGAVAHSILCNIVAPYGLITRINGNGDVLQQAQRENTNAEWFNLRLQPLGGNVGIGNTSPTERLDVSGNIKASGDITANKFIGYIRGDIIYDNGTDEGHFIGLGSNGVGVKGLLNYVYGNFPILFYTNGFERMRIGDYVGIGNSSPTERLDVSGNIKASGNINATSITINGVTITASNGSITVNGNVFATGAITAKA